MTQQAGRHTSLTFVTRLRPGGSTWLRTLFGAARRMRWVTAPLVRLDEIHFARWTVLPNRQLLFESDFDDSLPRYIDTFADVVAWRMRGTWSTSYGYPGLIPTDQFYAWVSTQEATPGHYYVAYPEASTAMVGRSLRLQRRLEAFGPNAEHLGDEAFATEYRAFLTEVQQWL